MPLVVITGMPCTGKTSCAQKLEKYFTELSKRVILISEHDYAKVRH